MKLPRDLPGAKLAKLLHRYGYEVTRQTGSHLRLTSSARGAQHHITIPRHKNLSAGTLHSILVDIAAYVQMDRRDLIEELFRGD